MQVFQHRIVLYPIPLEIARKINAFRSFSSQQPVFHHIPDRYRRDRPPNQTLRQGPHSSKSDYPAKLLLAAAKRTNADWCADAVKMCQVLDRRMKSEKGIDAAGELKLLLVRLGARRV